MIKTITFACMHFSIAFGVVYLMTGSVLVGGAVALVLGGEDKGLSPTLRDRCDAIARVPTGGELESLNVSVTGAILMFEKVRQDRS